MNMQFEVPVQIIGIKKFAGTIEGKEFDSCKVRAMVPVDEQNGNEKGFNVIEYSFGKSHNASRFDGQSFPFQCVAKLEIAMKGQKQVVNMIDFKLQPAPKPQA